MRRSPILFTAVCAVLCAVPGAGAQEVAPADPDSLARWQEMRFGLFIH